MAKAWRSTKVRLQQNIFCKSVKRNKSVTQRFTLILLFIIKEKLLQSGAGRVKKKQWPSYKVTALTHYSKI